MRAGRPPGIAFRVGRVDALVTGPARQVVTLADGTTETFDTVASNADIVHTYEKLLGQTPRGRSEAKRLKGARFSPSLFVVHFGLKAEHPQMRHHTICFGARYRELIGEIYGKDGLADDFSLYIPAPGASDKGS